MRYIWLSTAKSEEVNRGQLMYFKYSTFVLIVESLAKRK